jgi:hypothetical protein
MLMSSEIVAFSDFRLGREVEARILPPTLFGESLSSKKLPQIRS